ncbi:MAG: glucose 1-dehydrogenase [Dehalococcoidia bacterium]|nr:glucose 1-dehydrogenase [Dehalococcoidia bacterium]
MSESNKVAIITGDARGIGKGIARVFVKNGINVVMAGKDLKKLENTIKDIKLSDVEVYPVKADVAVPANVESLFDKTIEKFGKVDILVNNAGTAEPSGGKMADPITDFDHKVMDEGVNVNYKSVFYCSQRAAKEMKAKKKGVILNIASVDGLVSTPGTVYGPMKAAVIHFTKVLSRELATVPIRVNCICPGLVLKDTPDRLTDHEKDLLKFIPMHRALEPEDIGNLAYFLASDETKWITGSVVTVDEGITADGGWFAFGL